MVRNTKDGDLGKGLGKRQNHCPQRQVIPMKDHSDHLQMLWHGGGEALWSFLLMKTPLPEPLDIWHSPFTDTQIQSFNKGNFHNRLYKSSLAIPSSLDKLLLILHSRFSEFRLGNGVRRLEEDAIGFLLTFSISSPASVLMCLFCVWPNRHRGLVTVLSTAARSSRRKDGHTKIPNGWMVLRTGCRVWEKGVVSVMELFVCFEFFNEGCGLF